jgi:hypothetical protein
MGDGISLEIASRGKVSRTLSGHALQDAYQFDIQEIVGAVESAAVPGLMALRRNVSGINRVTGRLSGAPGTVSRVYRRRRTGLVGVALVGYRAGVAPHANLVESGTKQRSSRKGNRGKMSGKFPLRRAFDSSRSAMASKLSAEMQRLMAAKTQDVAR